MKEVNKNRKDEILSHHTEVNIDEIWAAIEPQVDLINAEKKRKKRFFIFFLCGAMLLASGLFYTWGDGIFETKGNTTSVETNDTSEIEANDTKNTKTLIQEKQEQLPEKVKAKSSVEISDKQSVQINKTGYNKTGYINKAEQEKTKSSIAAAHPITVISDKSAVSSNEKTATKVELTVAPQQNNTKNYYPNDDFLKETISIKDELSSNEGVTITEETTKEEILSSEETKSTISNSETPVIDPPLPNSTPELSEVNVVVKEEEVESSDEEEEKLPGTKLNFALAANSGISFINRSIASNIEGEASPEVLKLRRESETLLEAIHYGLRAKLTHKSGFSLSTGAQYTVLSERYDNNNIAMESDSIEGVIKIIIQPDGDTVNIIGLVPRTTTYDYEKQIYNRYKMIDIPFIVGFEGGMEKWSLGIQAGVFVNLALKTSGQIRSAGIQDLNIGDNQADVFKSKVGLSYYGGIYIRRALSPYLDLTIAPHGRFFVQEFNVEEYALKQKYSLIGVQAGLSYRFGY